MANIKKRIGNLYKAGGQGADSYNCYCPKDLPLDPALDLARLVPALTEASTALGELRGMLKIFPKNILPEKDVFTYFYLRREAILSSRIEGIQSSFFGLLYFELTRRDYYDDAVVVLANLKALQHGFNSDLPISTRLICQMHKELMTGTNKTPGAYRTSQNWIGGTSPSNARFVPPPHQEIAALMSNLEKFINDNTDYPTLIKAAISHVQFETIHPFLDGNGRIGRILISLILQRENVLLEPYLYLSLYLKQHRQEYYTHLHNIRTTGDWEAWVEFFLRGVTQVAEQCVTTTYRLLHMIEQDKEKISNAPRLPKSLPSVYEVFTRCIIADIKTLVEGSGQPLSSVSRAVEALQEMGIVTKLGESKRNRYFIYQKYLDILESGTQA